MAAYNYRRKTARVLIYSDNSPPPEPAFKRILQIKSTALLGLLVLSSSRLGTKPPKELIATLTTALTMFQKGCALLEQTITALAGGKPQ